MRRIVWALVAGSVGACVTAEDQTDDIVHTDSDTLPTHTDHVDTDVEDPNARPLCLEGTTSPPIAEDLVSWGEALAATSFRFYGQREWQSLEALGDDDEDLGPTAERRVMNRILRGWYRIVYNDLAGAVSDLQKAEALAISSSPSWRGRARLILAIAYMRKAETDNCITNGSGEACIIPFSEHGVHTDQEGMANAAAALLRALEQDVPDQVSPKWLLNVSYMARGMWPDQMPETWRLPTDLMDSEEDVPAWKNVLPELRHVKPSTAGGSAADDFDGDGLVDLMVSGMAPDGEMRLYLNNGDGTFCDASDESGLRNIPGVLSFAHADYDNDGDLDVFAPRGAWMSRYGTVRPSLLRNDGEGRFTDVAVAAGVAGAQANGPTQIAAWGDFDLDGCVDLYVGREDDEGTPTSRRVSSLYRNKCDGTFVDVGAAAGVASSGFVKGASWGDLDNDGYPDLYVSSLRSANRLYRNMGNGTFKDFGEAKGVAEPFKSFPTAIFDYDQDGHLDILAAAFTNNYSGGGALEPTYMQSAESYINDKLGLPTDPFFSETARLYRNEGDATGFEDVTEAVGLDDIHATMGMSYGDFDMDGYPDVYFATGAPEFDALEPNTAYRNAAGLAFRDVTTATHTGHIQKGHGVAFADLDEDGDEDMLVQMGGVFPGDVFPDALFRNPTNMGATVARHSVTLRLEGVTCNRSAIGARVRVVTPGRTFHHLVGGSGSFGSNSLQIEAAIADETEVTRVEIDWPGGDTEVLTDVPVDHVVQIRQGEGVVSSRALARFMIGHPGDTTHTDEGDH